MIENWNAKIGIIGEVMSAEDAVLFRKWNDAV
jgi:hypothetical protein